MKTTRHSLMAKGIMVLLSLLVLIFAFTYSWFIVPPTSVSATGITVSTNTQVDFEVAIGFSSSDTRYAYTVSDFKTNENPIILTAIPKTIGEDTKTYNLLRDYSPKDVTGNGAKLFIPVLTGDSPRTINTTTDSYTTVTPNKEYISFDMIFRSANACRVYLDTDSYVKAACESTPGDGHLTETTSGGTSLAYNDERRSGYGMFSADAVVGAVRVAFIDYTGLTLSDIDADSASLLNSNPEVIWLPRPDVYLYNNNNATSGWELITGITEGQTTATLADGTTEITLDDDTYTHSYYDLGVDGTHTIKAFTNTITECNADSIVTVNVYNAEEDLYYGKVRVNIWIEGTDAEARRAISNGSFYVNFDLRAG